MNDVKGFLKAAGSKLVNGDGKEILLRGVGFGSWLLPEGYMWHFPVQGDRPRRIEKMIENLIGNEAAKQFWECYYERFICDADIRQIAEEGFNSVRIPINARFILEEGKNTVYNESHLMILDDIIRTCEKHSLYVILDLHGAPGGQTGTNIDDSEFDKPDLFINSDNKILTINIWRMLAKRYKDEWIVAGFDLLNEPLPNWFSAYSKEVMPLYKSIVSAIREVDVNHMIILEGAHWSTDWSIFNDKFDNNIMLQFHKYWNNPDTESIQVYLDKREEWNVPIFMGEGGENNKDWYAGAFGLYEDHNISWNFWTWKKMDTNNSPCSIKIPKNWNRLVEYLEGGSKPDKKTAEDIFMEYLNNINFTNCIYNSEVVNALFRRPPVRIPAVFYGNKGKDISYGIGEVNKNSIDFRINDGTNIKFIESAKTIPNFQHGRGESWQEDERLCIQINPLDWLVYEIAVQKLSKVAFYSIGVNMCTISGTGKIAIMLNNIMLGTMETKEISWEQAYLDIKFELKPGKNKIIIRAEENPVLVEWIEVKPII